MHNISKAVKYTRNIIAYHWKNLKIPNFDIDVSNCEKWFLRGQINDTKQLIKTMFSDVCDLCQTYPPSENSFYFVGLKMINIKLFLLESKAKYVNFNILKESYDYV